MKLFNNFEAVKFIQENLIFITHSGYIYYIYDPEYKHWAKHGNAGNDHITVAKYAEVTKEELIEAMNGSFPKKETDFLKMCRPNQLHIGDMLDLLEEDYKNYISDYPIRNAIHRHLLESDVCHKSFLKIKELLDNANLSVLDKDIVLNQIKELSFKIIGRDIYKEEIGIVDGHDGSSYFWIMPARVIDFSNTNSLDNVAEMRSVEISIEEDDIYLYLTPFLYKYFDSELEANKRRLEDYWIDDDGNEHAIPIVNFEWNLTHNFFTFDSIKNILKDINDTVVELSSGQEKEYIKELRKKRSIKRTELIIDFYQRFSYRMEYMLRVGEEKGYNLILFMGP